MHLSHVTFLSVLSGERESDLLGQDVRFQKCPSFSQALILRRFKTFCTHRRFQPLLSLGLIM